jgi:hypothetical protein
MWTTRGDAPMLAFIEQVLVARGHVVEREQHPRWNRLTASLRGPLAGILGCRGFGGEREVKAACEAEAARPVAPDYLCRLIARFRPAPPKRARLYFGFHSRANHVSRETMAGIV